MLSGSIDHNDALPGPRVGNHICCLYSSEAERLEIALPNCQDALRTGQRILHIATPEIGDAFLAGLRASGIDPDDLRASGRLILLTPEEAYLPDGSFAPEHTLALLRRMAGQATESSAGTCRGLRVIGEMSWVPTALPDFRQLIEYEKSVNSTLQGLVCVALCLYDRRLFSAELLLDVLQTHPFVMLGNDVQANPYYIPPAAMAQNTPQARLDAWLGAIADRRRQENALRDAETRYRIVADNTYDWELWTGTDGRLLYVSPSSERLTGYPAERFIADPGLRDRIVHPDDLEAYLAHRHQVYEMGSDGAVEFRIVRPDGQIRWLAHVCVPVSGPNGEHLGRRDSNRDVTARKHAEEALRQGEARLRAVLLSLDEGFTLFRVVADSLGQPVDFLHVEMNLAAERIASQRRQDVLGRTMLELYPDAEPQWIDTFRRVALTGQPVRFEMYNHNAAKWFDVYVFRPTEGEVATIYADITERRHATEEREQLLEDLEVERERWRATVESMLDLVSVCDARGVVTYINPAYKRHIGYLVDPDLPLDEHPRYYQLFRSDGTLFAPEDLPLQRAALTGQEVRDVEVVQRTADGREYVGIFSAAPVRDSSGRVVGAVVVGRDVTEQRRTEGALQQIDSRLRIAKQAAGLGIYDWDVASGEVQWDARMRELWGVAPDVPVTYATFMSGVHPDDRALTQAAVDRALDPAGSGSFYGEYRAIELGTGRQRWIAATGHTIFEKDRAIRLVGAVQDVTARKLAEAALQESERKFSIMFEKAAFAAALSRLPDGVLVDVNEEWVRSFGYSRAEALGRTSLDLGINPDAAGRQRILGELHEHRSVRGLDMALRTKSGERRNFTTNVDLVEIGGQTYLLNTTQDITERQRAEEALRESEERNRSVFEQAAVGMVDADLSGRILRANTRFCDFVGYSEAELHGRRFQDITHPDHVDSDSVGVRRLIAGEIDHYFTEKRYLRKDGAAVWGRSHVSLIRSAAGAPGHFVTIVQDISEQKRAESVFSANQARLLAIDELNRRQPLTVSSLCEFALEHSLKLTGSEVGYLFFFDEDTQSLTNYAWSRSATERCAIPDKQIVYQLTETGLWGDVIRDRRPIITNAYSPDIWSAKGFPDGHVTLHRHLGVPVFSGTRIVAVIGVGNKERPYDDDDVQQLNQLMDGVWRIVERLQADQALRESEQRYRSLFTEMMTGFALHEMIYDASGKPIDYRFIDINPAFQQMTGLDRDMAIGKTVRELLPGTEDYWIEAYGQVASTGVPIHFENYARQLGKYFEVIAYSPQRGQFAVTFNDATDRRRASDTLHALAQSTPASGGDLEFYRTLVKHLATALHVRWAFVAEVIDPDATRARVLAFWADDDFLKPYEYDLAGLPGREVLREGLRNYPREVSRLFPNMTLIQEMAVEGYIGVPLLDTQGSPIGILGIMDDNPLETSESSEALVIAFASRASAELVRSHVEQALAASERKYRQIVELVPEGFWVVDADSITTFANQTLAEMLGYTPDEMIGQPVTSFRPATDYERMNEAIARRRTGVTESYELDLLKRDGTTVPARASASPVFDDAGRYAGTVALIENLTERRKLERERQDLEQRLFQSQKMEAIGSLAGGVAHDFNNMLGIILGHTSLLEMEIPPESPLRETLRIIDQTCERGSALTRQLLGFARRGKHEEKPFNPSTLVEEVAGLARRTFDRSIVVETRIESQGWAVVGDPNQIHQALMNMAINARDAMPNGGRLTLSVENATLGKAYALSHPHVRPGRHVILSVVDTGTGMTPDVKERAFEPFFTTKEVGKGTGLGLASAYGIVENHGGHIEIDSEPGFGTKISIYLPASDDGESHSEQPTGRAEMPTGTATILLVDDEPAIRDVGALVLSRLGYNVLTANDGAQAIEIYRAQQSTIGLVVLDMSMPVLGGHEAAQQLLAINPQCRLLLASGYSADGEVAELLKLENVSFVQKPFRARQLADAVSAALGGEQ